MEFDQEACIRGDAEAWTAFCDETIRLVVASIRRVCPSGRTPHGEDMDDLVQAVYIKLLKNDRRLLRNYDPARSAVSTWITLIARSVAIDALRRRSLDARPIDDAAGAVAGPPRTAPTGPAIPTHLLTARQQLVLSMLFEDEMDVADVAAALGVSPQTIRSTKHKAMERLRAHFQASDAGDDPTRPDVEPEDRT
ncbi:MAG: sigma-70 family RNA polymerase sigma factor [Phycisphaerales bacterium]|jgi:RNA polymerase sigma-70 factor (ECF subfamily)|nr:sigma-70 family RNA polymerase sigma factor [Phycisphaerales bacterium]